MIKEAPKLSMEKILSLELEHCSRLRNGAIICRLIDEKENFFTMKMSSERPVIYEGSLREKGHHSHVRLLDRDETLTFFENIKTDDDLFLKLKQSAQKAE